jgi:Uma2 family endonuclease
VIDDEVFQDYEGPPNVMYDTLRAFVERTFPGHDVEIRDGEYVVVAPHDWVSSTVVIQFGSLLNAWVRPRKLGWVLDSNGGTQFEDGDMRAADVTYVSRDRLPHVPRRFGRVIPELIVEVRSSKQSQRAVRRQIESLMDKGIEIGVYVDPERHRVEIHRPGAEPVVLGDDDRFEIPDLLPGFGFPVRELWPE